MFPFDLIFYEGPHTRSDVVNAFFLYSFCGWVMECLVIRLEKGRWENRGFVHLPLCIIYGFGAMIGYAMLRPISHNYVLLYLAGAFLATVFEYLTGRLMLRLFGKLWWDYSEKRLNYHGILCLESTVAWGAIAVLVFALVHRMVFSLVTRVPEPAAPLLAGGLCLAYLVDFALSARSALHRSRGKDEEELYDPS